MKRFTLIELVAALTIIAIGSTFAVSAFRGESPVQALNRTALEFEAYCARVRYRSAEEGRNWNVRFDEENGRFLAEADRTEEEEEEVRMGDRSPAPPLVFRLSEEVKFRGVDERTGAALPEGEEEMAEEEEPVLHFYSDGSASGRGIAFVRGNLSRCFKISPLTGRLLEQNQEESRP